jgi:hypothetical protein
MSKTQRFTQDDRFINHNLVHRYITVKFAIPGIHCYPDAPEQVAYLRNPHRHVFHYQVDIQVFHDDREIEFHMFLNELKNLFDRGDLQCDYKSCEMLIDDLAEYISTKYPNRDFTVMVSEDLENSATSFFSAKTKSI